MWVEFFDGGLYYMIVAEAFLIALSPTLATAAALLGLVCYIGRFASDAEERYFRHLPFDVPVAIFAALGAVSILVSPDPGFSFYNYYNLVGVYLLTYFLVGQRIRTSRELKTICYALLTSLLLVVFYGFSQFVFGIDTNEMKWVDGDAFPELKKRIFSTWENPNILAGYLDVMIALAFGFLIKLRNRSMKVLLGVVILLSAACLAMTYARGAVLTIAAVLALYGMLRDWRVLLGVTAVGAGLLTLDSALYERVISVFTQMDTSMEMRIALWDSTVQMIADHPFFGIGWGAYWMVYPAYDFYLEGADVLVVHAHNMYLNYAAEIGVVGALTFFWYFFGTMLRAFLSKAEDTAGFRQGLMLGLALAILSIALNGVTDYVLFNIPSSMLFYLLAAMVGVGDALAPEDVERAAVEEQIARRNRLRMTLEDIRAKKEEKAAEKGGDEA
ncbi:O-antigen ligase family protein [Selenomonas sp. TAMA-11512]|uniref:O-antigen ligase family protein n=1 Tax=Selenomonas sp. TAMA-11512 TaxID=3095337 RepID=UPI0030D1FA22